MTDWDKIERVERVLAKKALSKIGVTKIKAIKKKAYEDALGSSDGSDIIGEECDGKLESMVIKIAKELPEYKNLPPGVKKLIFEDSESLTDEVMRVVEKIPVTLY